MLERARKKSGAIEWVQGDALALPFGDGEFDAVTVGFGVRNLEDLGGGLAELARVLRPGGRSRCSRSRVRAGSCARSSGSGSTSSSRSRGGCSRAGRRTRTFRRACGASPGPRISPRCIERRRLPRRALPAPRRRQRRAAHGGAARERPGASSSEARPFLDELEQRLELAVERYPGLVAAVGRNAVAAGGKRLRPLLVHLTSPYARARAPRGSRGRARARGDARPRRPHRRRGAPPRPLVRLARARRRTPRAPAATTSSRARSPSSRSAGDLEGVEILARALPRDRARRGDAAAPGPRSRHADRGVPRAHRAEDREALRGRVPARLARRATRRVRARARDRVPDRGRHPRLRRRHDRDREDPRRRPPRGRADAAADPRRARGRGRPRARSPAGRCEGALVRVAATSALERSRATGARLR